MFHRFQRYSTQSPDMKFYSPRYLLICFTFISLLFACNNEEVSPYQATLGNPPYKEITDSIKDDPGNVALYARRGGMLNKNELPELALKDFKKAWELSGEEKYALAVGNLMLETNPDSSIHFLLQAGQKINSSKLLPLTLAYAYDAKGDINNALTTLDSLLTHHPQELEALLLKNDLLQRKQDTAGAIAVLEKAYSLAPQNKEIINMLSYQYAETNNNKALALADILISLDKEKTSANPYYVKGLYYVNQRQNDKALALFNQALTVDYNYLNAYIEKGKILLAVKKNAEALKTFQLANTISPSFPDAYFWIGKTYESNGDKVQAKEYYNKAYQLDKSFTEAKQAAEAVK